MPFSKLENLVTVNTVIIFFCGKQRGIYSTQNNKIITCVNFGFYSNFCKLALSFAARSR